MNKSIYYVLPFCLLSLAGCGDTEVNEPGKPEVAEGIYEIKGKVEKGPFLSGSAITVQELDHQLNPTGRVFQETILDDAGHFDLGTLELASPFALLSANGYYYNEVQGDLSQGTILLQSYVDLSDKESVNLNLITHLQKERILKMVKGGKSFAEANATTRKELLGNFGLQRFAEQNAASFTITAGTDEAGALITLSSILLEGHTDASFTEFLASVRKEFTEKGSFDQEAVESLREISMSLDFDYIAESLQARYRALGQTISVRSLRRFVDWDGNGVAGDELPAEDTDPVLRFACDTLRIPAEGGTFNVAIEANVPFDFEKPGVPGGSSGDTEYLKLWKTEAIRFEKSIEGAAGAKSLRIVADAAPEGLIDPAKVEIYDFTGDRKARLVIVQESTGAGKPALTKDGESAFVGVIAQMSLALGNMHVMEGYYTHGWTPTDGLWRDFGSNSVTPGNSCLATVYGQPFKGIAFTRQFRARAEHPDQIALMQNLEAIMYAELLNLWNVAPYPAASFDLDTCYRHEKMPAFVKHLGGSLERCVELLPDERVLNNTVQSVLYPSADAARVSLARLALASGDRERTLALLDEVIDSDRYRVEPDRGTAWSTASRELIFSLKTVESDPFNYYIEQHEQLPLITFTEVLLMAAEAAYGEGDLQRASRYLAQVTSARGVHFTPELPFMEQLRVTWMNALRGSNTYLAFMNRNNLAASTLGVSPHATILPIPAREISVSMCAVQNPGY